MVVSSSCSGAPQPMGIRIRAMVDIGDCLLAFTCEDDRGRNVARARAFDLHTRSWHPSAVPILPARIERGEEGWEDTTVDDLPLNGRWQMRLLSYSTLVCIFTSPSEARLIYLHVDRSPTLKYPLSLFVKSSRDIRPRIESRRDAAFLCTVLYDHSSDGVERVTIVTDDYQCDRDSLRLHEEVDGKMHEFAVCNLADSVDDLIITRNDANGDVLMVERTNPERAYLVNRTDGNEKEVEITIEEGEEEKPVFDSDSSFFCAGLSHSLDSSGRLWNLDALRMQWRRVGAVKFGRDSPASSDTTTDLVISPFTGRVLTVCHTEEVVSSKPLLTVSIDWRWLQPATLRELALSPITEVLQSNRESRNDEAKFRSGRDTTVFFIKAILK